VNLRLEIARCWLPRFLMKRELAKLFALTAEAFGSAPPPIAGLSLKKTLVAFARFTQAEAERSSDHPDARQQIQETLFRGAFELGDRYRHRFRLSGTDEALDAARIIYRGLGIDLYGTAQGEITVRSCFFSSYYAAATCRLISSLDAGLLAGLSGGGELTFWQRITEGHEQCRARLSGAEPRK
jgi:hypothetical protein